jgi:hypothetical protein
MIPSSRIKLRGTRAATAPATVVVCPPVPDDGDRGTATVWNCTGCGTKILVSRRVRCETDGRPVRLVCPDCRKEDTR